MPVTPTGALSLPLSKLKALLAASTTWSAWTTAPLVLTSIYLVAVESLPTRPFALISHDYRGGAFSLARHALGSVAAGMPSGRLLMTIEADIVEIAADDGRAQNEYEFTNRIGAILEEMSNLAQGVNNGGVTSSGHLGCNRFTVVEGPKRLHADQQTASDRYRIVIAIDWADFLGAA